MEDKSTGMSNITEEHGCLPEEGKCNLEAYLLFVPIKIFVK